MLYKEMDSEFIWYIRLFLWIFMSYIYLFISCMSLSMALFYIPQIFSF